MHQDDDCGSNGDRGYGVENDAEGAVVGVGLEGVGMSHLNGGKEGQQNEAQNGGRQGETWAGKHGLASSWLELTQSCAPYLKDTLDSMRNGTGRLHRAGYEGAR